MKELIPTRFEHLYPREAKFMALCFSKGLYLRWHFDTLGNCFQK